MSRQFIIFIFLILLSFSGQAKLLLEIPDEEALDDEEVQVFLPSSYNTSGDRKYPVIYLLDSSPFYKGDFAKEGVETIRQLELLHDFPETIIVHLKFEKLYQAVTTKRKALNSWFQHVVQPELKEQYRALNKSVFIGFSYSAAWTSAELALSDSPITELISISPVFDSINYVQLPAKEISNVSNLTIIYGNEEARMIETFKPIWEKLGLDKRVKVYTLEQENHQSVYLPGLRKGLLKAFRDYQGPSYKQLASESWTPAMVDEYFASRYEHYNVKSTLEELSHLSTMIAKTLTERGDLVLAKQHWNRSNSPHKRYFIEQISDKLKASGQIELAHKVTKLADSVELHDEEE